MGIVVIGRGIDLSIIATMAISVAWTLNMVSRGMPTPEAFALGAGFAIIVGVLNGIFIAYVEVPALFATLAMGTFVYGFGRSRLFEQDIVYLPASLSWMGDIGRMHVAQIPFAVTFFAAVCVAGFLLLKYTRIGRYFYFMGDNYLAARITGIATRPMTVIQYGLASFVAFIAGLVTTAAVTSMNTRVVNSTLIYDVILVVVVGGIGLKRGGRYSQRHHWHAADWHSSQCNDDHGCTLHAAEPDQKLHPAGGDPGRQHCQSARRADRSARGYLNGIKRCHHANRKTARSYKTWENYIVGIKLLALLFAGVVLSSTATKAQDQGLVDPGRASYFSEMKGKKVVFLPLAMDFISPEGWT